jgi:type VI secretion system protein ImpK
MHLTDCFMEMMAYVVYFQKTVSRKQPPYDQVRADIMRLLSQSESCVKKGLYSSDDFDQARFAICAWVDEVFLASSWNSKGKWQTEQLQRIYYNTTEAGEEIFDRLNTLGPHQREIREVYYLCLALGFKGRFIHPKDEFLLDQLKTSNLKLLIGSSVGLPSLERTELFPEAHPTGGIEISQQKQKFSFSAFTLMGLTGPVILFGLLFLVYKFSLSGLAENFLRTVP